MREEKKIRITVKLPWADEGSEYKVTKYQGIPAIRLGGHLFQLHELDGFYEVVRFTPILDQSYVYVNFGCVIERKGWDNSTADKARWAVGNCDEDNIGGRERITAKALQVLAIFKEES